MTDKQTPITMGRGDLFALLSSATRYALGRQSYVTDEVAGLIRTYFHELWPQQRKVIRRDVCEYIKETGGLNAVYWQQLINWMDGQEFSYE
jgi:hypothetical protein